MTKCVPIKDMRDTVAFSKLVENSSEPVIVTKNGYDQFVVLRSDDYDQLRLEAAKAQLAQRMLIAEKERSDGTTIDAHDSVNEIKDRYGI